MAIQTLNTIKNWFKTGLKPTQTQFWDTWDSFRHQSEKVPVADVEGIDELLNSKTDESDFKTINGESILGSGDILIKTPVDATPSVKGVVQLTGDLGGTADNPTVPALAGKQETLISGTNLKTVNGVSLLGSGDVPFTAVSGIVSGIVNNTPLQELGGVDKTIRGVRIGKGNSSGIDNVVFGINSQNSATTAEGNHSFGFEALRDLTTGIYNNAFGWGALQKNTIGTYNNALGNNALGNNTSGSFNVAIGGSALRENTTASSNTAIGVSSLRNNTTGSFNTAIGSLTLTLNTGSNSTSIGSSALRSNTTGSYNTAMGIQSLYSNISGNYNTAIGANSLYFSTAEGNVALGNLAGSHITTGARNVVIASQTGITHGAGTLTTGSNNLVIAQNNGSDNGLTTGSGNTILGKTSGLSSSLSNTVILSDGIGTQRFVSNSNNLTTLPAQTTALITADGTGKSILTKEYLGTRIGTVAPSSATDTGVTGEIRVVSGYIYWCIATNTWIRAAGTTF
ncbi:hypothetical protein [Flavobacterium sp. MDT1-60]|uniref:hypothetical protein n=1 Tax=Flavobacterium sp. MDT1-60 TaxID=1979344 RepID=UPI0017807EF4|nr:hypothetical protein [Flavobacterium sp. MDT1-60]QOG04346.1 hypothetical protein IHE43_09105 [Flavobacterium sp. MDT1-60]